MKQIKYNKLVSKFKICYKNNKKKVLGGLFIASALIGGCFVYGKYFQNNDDVALKYLDAVLAMENESFESDSDIKYKVAIADDKTSVAVDLKTEKAHFAQKRNEKIMDSDFAFNADFDLDYNFNLKDGKIKSNLKDGKFGVNIVFKDGVFYFQPKFKDLIEKLKEELEKNKDTQQVAGLVTMANLYDNKVIYIDVRKLLPVIGMNEEQFEEVVKESIEQDKEIIALLKKAQKEGNGILKFNSNGFGLLSSCYNVELNYTNLKKFVENNKTELAKILQIPENDFDEFIKKIEGEFQKLTLEDKKTILNFVDNFEYNVCMSAGKIEKEEVEVNINKEDILSLGKVIAKFDKESEAGFKEFENFDKLNTKFEVKTEYKYTTPKIKAMKGDVDLGALLLGLSFSDNK